MVSVRVGQVDLTELEVVQDRHPIGHVELLEAGEELAEVLRSEGEVLQLQIALCRFESSALDEVHRRAAAAVHPRAAEREVWPGARRHAEHVGVKGLQFFELGGVDVDVVEALESHAVIPYHTPVSSGPASSAP